MIIWFHTSTFRSTEYLSHQIIVLKLSLHKLCSLDGTSFLLDWWYTIFRWSSVSVMVWHAISYMSVLYLDIFSLRVCWLSISLWLNVSCLFRESWSWSFPVLAGMESHSNLQLLVSHIEERCFDWMITNAYFRIWMIIIGKMSIMMLVWRILYSFKILWEFYCVSLVCIFVKKSYLLWTRFVLSKYPFYFCWILYSPELFLVY